MSRPQTKRPSKVPTNAAAIPAPNAYPEVLTLAEAAAYLRISEEELLRLVGPHGIPGRRINSEWRFLKAALQDWLRVPTPWPDNRAFLALAGAWKDDPDLEDLVQEAYRRRGRPITEEGR